jgi:hypothetical protein
MITLLSRLAVALPNQCFPLFPLRIQTEALALMRTMH